MDFSRLAVDCALLNLLVFGEMDCEENVHTTDPHSLTVTLTFFFCKANAFLYYLLPTLLFQRKSG